MFVMNLVLKRHPLAIHYIRTQMIDSGRYGAARKEIQPRDSVSSMGDDEDLGDSIEHFIIESLDRNNGSNSDTCTYYEESIPIEHFTKIS